MINDESELLTKNSENYHDQKDKLHSKIADATESYKRKYAEYERRKLKADSLQTSVENINEEED